MSASLKLVAFYKESNLFASANECFALRDFCFAASVISTRYSSFLLTCLLTYLLNSQNLVDKGLTSLHTEKKTKETTPVCESNFTQIVRHVLTTMSLVRRSMWLSSRRSVTFSRKSIAPFVVRVLFNETLGDIAQHLLVIVTTVAQPVMHKCYCYCY